MADPTLGEIRIVGFNFAPVGWAKCEGQLLSIAENDALYSLLGTAYGGDGQTTFGLPDLRGRVTVDVGQGPGLSPYVQGQRSGTESVTLTTNQMPAHTHPYTATVAASTAAATTKNPVGNAYPALAPSTKNPYGSAASTDTLATGAVTMTAAGAGGNQPHPNIQPVLALNNIICLEGIYPSRP
jgi:microcystin-dependent protein